MDMNELPAGAGAENAVPAAAPEAAGAEGAPQAQPAAPAGIIPPEAGTREAAGTGAEGGTAKEPEDMFSGLAPEEAKKDGEEGGEKKEGEGEGAPNSDETPPEIKMPENFIPDEAVMGSFYDVVKEGGIKPEVAQKLFDIHAAEVQKFAETYSAASEKAISDTKAQINAAWAKECQTDPEFGGENYNASRNCVEAAIRRFVPEAEQKGFVTFFKEANLQNNPHMFRFFCRVCNETSEADAVGSEGAAPKKELSVADRMFPNFPSAIQ